MGKPRFIAVSAGLLSVLFSFSALAVPLGIPYNGYLSDSDGQPYTGAVGVVAALFGQAEGGDALVNCQWNSLEVVSGNLSFIIGGETCQPNLDSTVVQGDLWLEVTIDDNVLSPRQQVLSVPFALVSGDSEALGGLAASEYVTSGELEDAGFAVGGDLAEVATSGAYQDLGGLPDLSVLLRSDGTVALAGPWDLAGQALSNLVVGASDIPPASSVAGQLWWDSAAGSLKVYTGSQWTLVSAAEGAAVASDLDCIGCVSIQELGFSLASVATSGAYGDLSGAPDLAGYALTNDLQPICFTGSVEDLADWDVSGFVTMDQLSLVAQSGDYRDLLNLPDLSIYQTAGQLAPVATTGEYGDLTGRPDLSGYALTAGLQPICFSGSAEDLVDLDVGVFVTLDQLALVALSGEYGDLKNRPDLSLYVMVSDLATVALSGAYEDLIGAPDPWDYLKHDGSVALSGDLDMDGHRLVRVAIDDSASAPEAPVVGQLWWDPTEKLIKVFDGETWKTVGGGDVAFASDCNTIDGLDSSAFELAGAVATHEVEHPHLGQAEYSALTGGPESNADAYHSHESVGSGLPNVNPALLNSVFTKKFCSTDTPQDLPKPIGQVVSSINIGEAGTVKSCTLEVEVTTPAPQGLRLTLSNVLTEIVISDIFQLDGTGNWEFDLTQQLEGEESSGTWSLYVTDLDSGGDLVTLENWCLTVEYMSSQMLEVKGDLDTSVGSTEKTFELLMGNMLSLALTGIDMGGQENFLADLFTSDQSQYHKFMVFDAEAQVFKTMETTNSYYLIVEAESLNENALGASRFGPSQWFLSEMGSEAAVNRAVLFSELFGSGETSPLIVHASGISSILTPHVEDVGRRPYYLSVSDESQGSSTSSTSLHGSFQNTGTNLGCSSWAKGSAGKSSYASFSHFYWEMDVNGWQQHLHVQAPSGSGATSSNLFGQVETQQENPAACRARVVLEGDGLSGSGHHRWANGSALVLCEGEVHWSSEGSGDTSIYDFVGDGGLPALGLSASNPLLSSVVFESETLEGTETHGLLKVKSEVAAGSSLTIEVSFDGGLHWKQVEQGKIFSIEYTGRKLAVRFNILRTAVSEISTVGGYAIYTW